MCPNVSLAASSCDAPPCRRMYAGWYVGSTVVRHLPYRPWRSIVRNFPATSYISTLFPNKAVVATSPIVMISSGSAIRNSSIKRGLHAFNCFREGIWLFGVIHATAFVRNTSFRLKPAVSRRRSRSSPEAPTNGLPSSSSWRSGAPPTIATSAGTGPCPGTRRYRSAYKEHALQSIHAEQSSVSALS